MALGPIRALVDADGEPQPVIRDDAAMVRRRQAAWSLGDGTDWSRVDDHAVLARLADAQARGLLGPAADQRPKLHRLRSGKAPAPAPAPLAPSQLAPRRPQTHWVQFKVADRLGKAVGGIPYKLILPGGAAEKDQLPLSGQLRKDDVPQGSFTLELGELVSAGWQAAGRATQGPVPASTALTLVAQTRHVMPGTVARFKVFRLYDEEPGRAIATADGQVGADGAVSAAFRYEAGADDQGRELAVIHACQIGKLWIKSPPLVLRLPRLQAPRWNADELLVGQTATLSVACPGMAEGKPVHFTICRADTGAAVAGLDATVQAEAAGAEWVSVDPDPETPESELYFEASCAGLKTRSRTMRLLDDVELVFQTDDGHALANGRIALEFGDGTRCIFRTDQAGVLRLTDPRARTARVLVADTADGDVVEES